ncbi:hypothetical protein HPB48_007752 [Haemaphysalis longicornis]|uniref:Fatty acid synthase pseudo-KR domain-containing protein n=1 Tax=Haemaphysalis longicornis TaxID=44386 RepID=A0A9J6FUG6_HAELO|nr:hypothetical protein HPB48_007752 [Haemaphysalis longicornis]
MAARGTKLVLAPTVSPLLSLFNTMIKVDYTVALDSTNALTSGELPEAVRTAIWDSTSVTANGLPEADLVVAHDFSASDSPFEDFVKQLCCHCKQRGFILLAYRTALTTAEELLSTVGEVPFRAHSYETLKAKFASHGFSVVAFKSNNISSLVLLRRSPMDVERAQHEVVRVQKASFGWVEDLKKKLAEYESDSAARKIWLLAEDSGVSGVVGLTNCLRVEIPGCQIRYVPKHVRYRNGTLWCTAKGLLGIATLAL